MWDVLSGLGASLPVLAAPMAGGPTTVELVLAASRVGSLGFLAGGYKDAATLAAQVRAVRAETAAFGVNLFVPHSLPVDHAAYTRYRQRIMTDVEAVGATAPEEPIEGDDHWRDKIDVLLAHPVPLVSFTFAIPDRPVLDALRAAGSVLLQTVTSVAEAEQAFAAGVDALIVQGGEAGGHSATMSPSAMPVAPPLDELVAQVRHRVGLPLIAAGGLAFPSQVAGVLRAGADAAAVGTALLLSPEAGTSAPYRAALAAAGRVAVVAGAEGGAAVAEAGGGAALPEADRPPAWAGADRGPTVVTRAFSGRPARALRNAFLDAHHAHAPLGYPALHHLTSPMRRAATAAGDPERINLWAGTGYHSVQSRPAGTILEELAGRA